MKTLSFVLVLCAGLVTVAALQGQAVSNTEQELVNLVNQQRAAQRLAPLRGNAQLMLAARAHSINMARQNTGAHVLDGKGPGERLRDVGYPARQWGENIAWGARTANQVMAIWIQSPPHRSNILNPYVNEIGVGVAVSRNGVPYWTQVFGRR